MVVSDNVSQENHHKSPLPLRRQHEPHHGDGRQGQPADGQPGVAEPADAAQHATRRAGGASGPGKQAQCGCWVGVGGCCLLLLSAAAAGARTLRVQCWRMQTSVCAGRALRVGPSANPGPAARAALHWQWQLTANFQRGCVAAAPCSRLLMRSGLGGLTGATAGVVGMAAWGHAGRRVLLPLQIPWQPLPPGKHEALFVLHRRSAPFQTLLNPPIPWLHRRSMHSRTRCGS